MYGWFMHLESFDMRKRKFSVEALPVGEPNIADIPRDGSDVRIMSQDRQLMSPPMFFNRVKETFDTWDGWIEWHLDERPCSATHWRPERVN